MQTQSDSKLDPKRGADGAAVESSDSGASDSGLSGLGSSVDDARSDDARLDDAGLDDARLDDAGLDDASQVFAGHEPDGGWLVRARSWIDVVPPLRLFRVLPLVGNPIWTLATWTIWIGWIAVLPVESVGGWFALLGAIVATIVVAVALFRQGALLTAGRSPEPLGPLVHRVAAGGLSIFIIVLLPAVVSLAFFPLAALAVAAGRISDAAAWQAASGMVAIVSISPAAVLLGCGVFAVPLALASWVNHFVADQSADPSRNVESNPQSRSNPQSQANTGKQLHPIAATEVADAAMRPRPIEPIDSLSRGYEYTFRGWPYLVVYTLIAACVSAFAYPLVFVVAFAAKSTLSPLIEWIGNPIAIGYFNRMLMLLPIAATSVVACGCVGGMMLLLRHHTGGQEIEDIEHPV